MATQKKDNKTVIPDEHFEHDLNLPDHVPISEASKNWQDNMVEQLKRQQKK